MKTFAVVLLLAAAASAVPWGFDSLFSGSWSKPSSYGGLFGGQASKPAQGRPNQHVQVIELSEDSPLLAQLLSGDFGSLFQKPSAQQAAAPAAAPADEAEEAVAEEAAEEDQVEEAAAAPAAEEAAAAPAAEEASADSSADSSADAGDEFSTEMLKVHNEYRAKHQAPALTYDSEIAKFAQEWADHLASTGAFEHRTDNNPYGENIFWTSANSATAKQSVDAWYSEVNDYKDYSTDPFANGGGDFVSGHFTQVVWKSSEKLGCGKSTGNKGTTVVCNYSPQGNYMGQFVDNVLPAQ